MPKSLLFKHISDQSGPPCTSVSALLTLGRRHQVATCVCCTTVICAGHLSTTGKWLTLAGPISSALVLPFISPSTELVIQPNPICLPSAADSRAQPTGSSGQLRRSSMNAGQQHFLPETVNPHPSPSETICKPSKPGKTKQTKKKTLLFYLLIRVSCGIQS